MSFTWSYSSLNAYETCPRQFYELKIRKAYKQVETEQIKWGNEVHKALEEKGTKAQPLPSRMQAFEEITAPFFNCEGEAYSELKLAITVNHKACDFFANDVWARGIVDRLIIKGQNALNIDWKTGKKKENSRQLMMSTGLVFANFPQVEKVTTAFVWLNEPVGRQITRATYHGAEYGKIWSVFDQPLVEMEWSFKNNAWPARPSGLCKKWCPVMSCEHNGLNPENKR